MRVIDDEARTTTAMCRHDDSLATDETCTMDWHTQASYDPSGGNVGVSLLTPYLVCGSSMVLGMVFDDGAGLSSRLRLNQKKDHGQLEKKVDASHSMM